MQQDHCLQQNPAILGPASSLIKPFDEESICVDSEKPLQYYGAAQQLAYESGVRNAKAGTALKTSIFSFVNNARNERMGETCI